MTCASHTLVELLCATGFAIGFASAFIGGCFSAITLTGGRLCPEDWRDLRRSLPVLFGGIALASLSIWGLL